MQVVLNLYSKLRFLNFNFDVEDFKFRSSTVKVRTYCNRKFTVLDRNLKSSTSKLKFKKRNLEYKFKTTCIQFYFWPIFKLTYWEIDLEFFFQFIIYNIKTSTRVREERKRCRRVLVIPTRISPGVQWERYKLEHMHNEKCYSSNYLSTLIFHIYLHSIFMCLLIIK